MTNESELSADVLSLDGEIEVRRITDALRNITARVLRRRGLVVAISGGIDSSVCAALAVAALGSDKVFGLLLPERDSSPESTSRGRMLAAHLGIPFQIHDIAPALEAIGCYRERDEAIQRTIPEYGSGWRSKIVIGGALEGQINHFRIVAESPSGERREVTLALREYLQIVAATNYKQRLRKSIEYFHADRLNYAVVGTPNRLEYDQGFFVKNGDGAADVKPIAHLYKSQVYALARHMQLPEEICSAQPTTDTYSLPQGQDEFYFALPYPQLDVALWGYNHDRRPSEVARTLGLTEEQVNRVYRDIEAKRRASAYLHRRPVLIDEPGAAAAERD